MNSGRCTAGAVQQGRLVLRVADPVGNPPCERGLAQTLTAGDSQYCLPGRRDLIDPGTQERSEQKDDRHHHSSRAGNQFGEQRRERMLHGRQQHVIAYRRTGKNRCSNRSDQLITQYIQGMTARQTLQPRAGQQQTRGSCKIGSSAIHDISKLRVQLADKRTDIGQTAQTGDSFLQPGCRQLVGRQKCRRHAAVIEQEINLRERRYEGAGSRIVIDPADFSVYRGSVVLTHDRGPPRCFPKRYGKDGRRDHKTDLRQWGTPHGSRKRSRFPGRTSASPKRQSDRADA